MRRRSNRVDGRFDDRRNPPLSRVAVSGIAGDGACCFSSKSAHGPVSAAPARPISSTHSRLCFFIQIRAALLVLLTHQLLEVRAPKLLLRNTENDAALRQLAKDVVATRERRKSKQTLEQAFASAAGDAPSNWHYGAPRYSLDVRAVLRRPRHARFIELTRDEHGVVRGMPGGGKLTANYSPPFVCRSAGRSRYCAGAAAGRRVP